jgi:hypothetical protein
MRPPRCDQHNMGWVQHGLTAPNAAMMDANEGGSTRPQPWYYKVCRDNPPAVWSDRCHGNPFNATAPVPVTDTKYRPLHVDRLECFFNTAADRRLMASHAVARM